MDGWTASCRQSCSQNK